MHTMRGNSLGLDVRYVAEDSTLFIATTSECFRQSKLRNRRERGSYDEQPAAACNAASRRAEEQDLITHSRRDRSYTVPSVNGCRTRPMGCEYHGARRPSLPHAETECMASLRSSEGRPHAKQQEPNAGSTIIDIMVMLLALTAANSGGCRQHSRQLEVL